MSRKQTCAVNSCHVKKIVRSGYVDSCFHEDFYLVPENELQFRRECVETSRTKSIRSKSQGFARGFVAPGAF